MKAPGYVAEHVPSSRLHILTVTSHTTTTTATSGLFWEGAFTSIYSALLLKAGFLNGATEHEIVPLPERHHPWLNSRLA